MTAPVRATALWRGSTTVERRERPTPVGGVASEALYDRDGAAATSRRKQPANAAVPRSSSSTIVLPDSACHAGGRGFESGRSRLSKCLQIAISVASLGEMHSSEIHRLLPGRLRGAVFAPRTPCKCCCSGLPHLGENTSLPGADGP